MRDLVVWYTEIMSKKEITNNEIMEALGQFAGSVDERFESINESFVSIDKSFKTIDKRFEIFANSVDKRFNVIDKRFGEIENKLDKRFDFLTNLIDGYAGKIDTYAQEMAAMDHKISRLEKYIQVLADKAGVDLDRIHV
jgi:flagellar capping protein FliD